MPTCFSAQGSQLALWVVTLVCCCVLACAVNAVVVSDGGIVVVSSCTPRTMPSRCQGPFLTFQPRPFVCWTRALGQVCHVLSVKQSSRICKSSDT